jgi:DNA-binding MarR family transcriptional regulator
VGRLGDPDYQRLLAFRTGLRQFLRWSEDAAATAGVTAAQHQLLLAVRGHDDPRGPTIGDIAGYLLTRHHSVVELVDRAERAKLVRRVHDDGDQRIVRIRLTPTGARRLEQLSTAHLEELARLAPIVRSF